MEPVQKIFTKEDKIKDGYEYEFNVTEDGLYLIEIIASAKSWWQNLLKIKFGDDDLTVKIDGIDFPKLNGKAGLFDGEVAWNGNNLKGLSKTNVFVVNLSVGVHMVTFLSDKSPILKSIKICSVNNKISYVPTDNNPAEDGDRRQWMTVIMVDLSLKNIAIKAIARNHPDQNDHDDIKLSIDSEAQLNEDKDNKSHRYWYWSGKILNGEEKEFKKEINKPKGFHYIEFWADRTPEIKSINLHLGLNNESGSGENEKRIPTVDDPEWTEDPSFNDDTEQMILARAIWGEARNTSREARIAVAWSIKNRLGTRRERDSYHHILLAPSQYSCFWEKPPKDFNLQALRSPLKNKNNPNDYAKWKETYEIAGQVISGEINDSTNGANHYYDDDILNWPDSKVPDWVKNGKVILKIGRLNFLYIK